MKHVFIVNPTSAKGKFHLITKSIKEICEQEKIPYQIICTKESKQAITIAKDFSRDKSNIIYSVGGDGTLFEVLNGMIDSECWLSVIPSGTGNDFYHTIENNSNLLFSIDVGKMNDYYFLNTASVGLDAEIAENKEKIKKIPIPASMVYKASILYSYFKYHPHEIEYQLNDRKITKEITVCAVCNGKYYGGGFPIAPKASVNDGKFDVYIANKMTKLQILGLLGELKNGIHESSPLVNHYLTDEITIKSKKELACNLDGEIIKDHEFHFQTVPKKLVIYDGHPAIKRFIKEKLNRR